MHEPNHPMNLLRWLRRRGWVHALAGFGALVALCAPLEVAFRTTDYFGLNYPAYVLAGRRQGRWMGKFWNPREFGEQIQRNSHGLAAPELTAGPEEERRVVVAGDSFVEALQVKRGDSFPLLADARNPRVRLVPVRVGNHAFPERHTHFLEFYDKLFDGDAGLPRANAVVYVLRDRALLQRRSPRLAIQKFVIRNLRLFRVAERYTIANVAVIGFTCSRFREWVEPSGAGGDTGEGARRRRTEQLVRTTLDRIEADTARLGLDVGVLYIPTWSEVADQRRHPRAGWRSVQTLRRLVEERGIPFEDATPDVVEHGGAQPFFAFDGHPNADGHRAMEPALTRLLAEMHY